MPLLVATIQEIQTSEYPLLFVMYTLFNKNSFIQLNKALLILPQVIATRHEHVNSIFSDASGAAESINNPACFHIINTASTLPYTGEIMSHSTFNSQHLGGYQSNFVC